MGQTNKSMHPTARGGHELSPVQLPNSDLWREAEHSKRKGCILSQFVCCNHMHIGLVPPRPIYSAIAGGMSRPADSRGYPAGPNAGNANLVSGTITSGRSVDIWPG